MKFVNVGFSNMIAAERIVALLSPDSAPAKRLAAEAKDAGRAVDCTSGRRTRSVILTDTGYVVLSAIQTETVADRIESGSRGGDDAE